MQAHEWHEFDEQNLREEREEKQSPTFVAADRMMVWLQQTRRRWSSQTPLWDHDFQMALRVEHLEDFDWLNPKAFEIADMAMGNYLNWMSETPLADEMDLE